MSRKTNIRKNFKIMSMLFLAWLSAGCEKEIYIDYRSVEPQTVIEGHISNEDTQVIVTTTRDMTDSVRTACVSDALVTIYGSDGSCGQLEYSTDGGYLSPEGLTGTPGVTYTLSVTRAGSIFTSESVMQNAPIIKDAGFYNYNLMGLKMLIYVVDVDDIVGEENWYCYRMYHNGELYNWNVMNDKSRPDDVLTVTVMCIDEKMARPDTDVDADLFIAEDDEIVFELQAIDENTYSYLYSLGISGIASSNPIYNFTNGGLGYFSACNVIRDTTVFRHDDILDFSER
ncbi:MAG: DUF4249 domain-containing protein [Bacteroidales bacterium]|nr:DUF4249 domain-containing protein [Bacteroidales bacterium]